jgi:hypothetical protein
MKYQIIEDADVITYVVVCDPDDEAVAMSAPRLDTPAAHSP